MRYFKIILSIILFAFLSCAKDIVDTTGGIKGTIKDQETGQLISNCQVALSNGSSKTTGNDGQFEFSNLQPDNYSMTFVKTGYENVTKNVTVIAGRNADVEISMKPLTGRLSVSCSSLDYGNSETTKSVDISNTGLGSLTWSVSENSKWFKCEPTSGTILPSQSATVVVTVDRDGMEKGSYCESLVLSSNGGSATVTVSMSVASNEVAVSPSSLDFGTVESSLEVKMSNPSGKTLEYTISTTNEWLSVSKKSGKITATDSFNAIVSRAGLSEGNYDGNIIIEITGSEISIPVKMQIAHKEKPAVSIEGLSQITANSATVNATLKSVGSSKVLRHGVCWSKTSSPTIEDGVKNLGDCTSAKSFECTITELESETKYYVRAYAENAEGISYSQEESFTTLQKPVSPTVQTLSVKDITPTSAKAYGKITSLGNVEKVTAYGHVWGTSPQPAIGSCQYSDLGETKKTREEFASDITALSPATTYYVRAYATNSEGTAYGDDVKITTKDYEAPTVNISEASNIQKNSFSVGGEIISTGGISLTDYGHCWSTSQNPTTSDSKTSLGAKSSEEAFNSDVSGLAEGTTYYVRAYAVNAKGTSYSDQITVTTTEGSTDKWDGTIASSFAGGSGTSVDPYLIETGGQLLLMKNYSGMCFKIENNIDLDNHNWLPFMFSGVLDGGNHVIKNLFIDRSSDSQGLFSELTGSISNVIISGVRISAGSSNYIGALAGQYDGISIDNCKVILKSDSKILGNSYVGGMVGSSGTINSTQWSSRTITRSEVVADEKCAISGDTNIGGILGYLGEGILKVEGCSFSGSISGSNRMGGIVGSQYYGTLTIRECSASASLSGQSIIGGIFGGYGLVNRKNASIYTSKAYVNINVTSGKAGGIVGSGGYDKYDYEVSIYSCYSTGTISSQNSDCTASGLGEFAYCHLSYTTVTSSLKGFKQLGNTNVEECAGSLSCNDITQTLKEYYSSSASDYNFNNTWTWTGTVDGKTKSVSCPKLSWEK